VHPDAAPATSQVELLAQMLVGPYPARHDQALDARLLDGSQALLDQNLDDGRLRRSRQVGQRRLVGRVRQGDGGIQPAKAHQMRANGGFQAREGKIKVAGVQHGARQVKSVHASTRGELREMRPTWIGQPHEFGGLVEGLARGIVDRLAQQCVLPHAIHPHQLGVPA
jgi:hypothetical protein